MSLSKSNSGFNHFDELENSGLLDDAIASATERRNLAQQDDSLPELLDEEANSIMGGLSKRPIPPIVVGLIAQDPQDCSGY